MKIDLTVHSLFMLLEGSMLDDSPERIRQMMLFTTDYYELMSDLERVYLYDKMRKDPRFIRGLAEKKPAYGVMEARFNPDNQYRIRYKIGSLRGYYRAYRLLDKYWINPTLIVDEKKIVSVKKINPSV